MKFETEFGVPDTRMVREARDLARDCSETYLYNHVIRSWLFAAELAGRAGHRPDPELLAVSAILHDLGLTGVHSTEENRFEVDGANAARSFLDTYALDDADLQTVWDAIALHSTRSIALHKGPVVAFCHSGVQVDVSGTELEKIDPSYRDRVLKAFPRLSFKRRLTEDLCGVIRRKPATSFDNFMHDFGERYVEGYKAVSAVDRLHDAPFES